MATTSVPQTGLGTKKSVFVLITVVGCIAILWPKILYFAMFGGQTNKPFVKDHRSGTGCCNVVLDQQSTSNISNAIAHPGFRKLNLITGEMSLRQERPPHLRPDGIHPAMRERGRAIPATTTIPIVAEEKLVPSVVPRIVEGRPGPIPGMNNLMRPPMGAGSNHQANHKGNSLGFIMPLYTVGIVAFFVYTIMKLVMKKPIDKTPYADAIKSNPEFQDQVFGQEKSVYKKGEGNLTNLGWRDHDTRWHANGNSRNTIDLYAASHPNPRRAPEESELEFHMRETEQLLEISLLKKKLLETEQAMSRIIADMGSISKGQDTSEAFGNLHANNGNLKVEPQDESHSNQKENEAVIYELNKKTKNNENGSAKLQESKAKEVHSDKSVKVLGMETTESCEGGQKWLRPSTPFYHVVDDEKPNPEPQSIFLEGSLPHDSQILVADSETKTETVFDDECDDDKDEPAVVISSKMTLSLINMDPVDRNGANGAEIDDQTDGEDVEELEDDDEEVNGHIDDEEIEDDDGGEEDNADDEDGSENSGNELEA